MNRFKNNLKNRCYFSAFFQASVGQREASFSRRLSDKQEKKKKKKKKKKRRFSTGQHMKKEAFMLQSRNTRTQLKYQKREVVQTDTQLQ